MYSLFIDASKINNLWRTRLFFPYSSGIYVWLFWRGFLILQTGKSATGNMLFGAGKLDEIPGHISTTQVMEYEVLKVQVPHFLSLVFHNKHKTVQNLHARKCHTNFSEKSLVNSSVDEKSE